MLGEKQKKQGLRLYANQSALSLSHSFGLNCVFAVCWIVLCFTNDHFWLPKPKLPYHKQHKANREEYHRCELRVEGGARYAVLFFSPSLFEFKKVIKQGCWTLLASNDSGEGGGTASSPRRCSSRIDLFLRVTARGFRCCLLYSSFWQVGTTAQETGVHTLVPSDLNASWHPD